MHWFFDETGNPYLDHTNYNTMDIRDSKGEVCSRIKYMNPTQASKYLRHTKETAGTQSHQEQKLKHLIQQEMAFVATSQMTPDITHKYYTTIFLKRITYPLTLSYFSKKKLRKLQQNYHGLLLGALGYNKNTAKPVRYGSPRFAGIGLRCLYLEQGILGLQQFIRHWRSNTNITRLLRIAVAWCQYSLGTGVSFLHDMNRDLPHFEAKWLKFIR